MTGGPGSGKTAVLELALRSFCSHVGVLPESVGIVFGGGFPRETTPVGRRAAQRAIYGIQIELQRLVVEEAKFAVVLCDRGTVDGAAYWPTEGPPYWSSLGVKRTDELARYCAVLHLRTPSSAAGYNNDNALRLETAKEAAVLDERILGAWAGHPRRFCVDASTDFVTKATTALEFLRGELPPCCQSHSIRAE